MYITTKKLYIPSINNTRHQKIKITSKNEYNKKSDNSTAYRKKIIKKKDTGMEQDDQQEDTKRTKEIIMNKPDKLTQGRGYK